MPVEEHTDKLTVAAAQIAPVWGDRDATLAKVVRAVHDAADKGAQLVAFGEALVPGYPYWIEPTHSSRWNDRMQKEIYSHYFDQAVCVERGDLGGVCAAAKARGIAVYLGVIERPADRGGHSLYCTLVYIDASGVIQSVHRKLCPTFGERLAWSPGDGHGLQTHRVGAFTAGGLNCWENWMPLVRAVLYGKGEDLHIATWPGGRHNTEPITPYIAIEGRSYVMSVSNLMRLEDFSPKTPHLSVITDKIGKPIVSNGGSCIAGPDGAWVLPPQGAVEGVFVATLDHGRVREERHNFDASGHYSRPDVVRLCVNTERLKVVNEVRPKL